MLGSSQVLLKGLTNQVGIQEQQPKSHCKAFLGDKTWLLPRAPVGTTDWQWCPKSAITTTSALSGTGICSPNAQARGVLLGPASLCC